MLIRFGVLFTLLAMVRVAAASATPMPVWPNLQVPTEQRHVTLVNTPPYGEVSRGIIHWPTLTQFPAIGTDVLHPAIVICPGGGYVQEALQYEGSTPAKWFANHGFSCFVLRYRLPDGALPANGIAYPLRDVQRAIQIVRANASTWHIDPRHIGVMGFSAGGSVASLAGVHWLPASPTAPDPVERASSRPNFMVLVYPVISMMPGVLCYQGLGDVLLGKNPPMSVLKYYSSELNVSASTPPAFICCANDDTVVPIINEKKMAAALQRNRVSVDLVIYDHGQHAFGMGRPGTDTVNWPTDCLKWLHSHALKG